MKRMKVVASSIQQACKACGAVTGQVKSGFNRTGTQRYLCCFCRSIYTPAPLQNGHPLKIRREALRLFANGESLRSVAKALSISPETVRTWVNYKAYEDVKIYADHWRARAEKELSSPKKLKLDHLFKIRHIMTKIAREVVEKTGGLLIDRDEYLQLKRVLKIEGKGVIYWGLSSIDLSGSYYESMLYCYYGNWKASSGRCVRLASTATEKDIKECAESVRHAIKQQTREM